MRVPDRMATAVVIDQWPMVRLGVGAVLAASGVRVVGESMRVSDGLLLARTHAAGLLVFGATADELGPAAVRLAKAEGLAAAVVLLVSSASGIADLGALLAAGADALLPASVTHEELSDALDRVRRGERVVAPSLGRSLPRVDDAEASAPVGLSRGPLTAKEFDVLALVAKGRTNKQIARALFVSDATVKTHLEHIYQKLDAQGRVVALSRAVELGLLT